MDRETREKVERYQKEGVLAVEMEISALFTVAKFRGAELGAMPVVSDELATFKWRPGFKMEEFYSDVAGKPFNSKSTEFAIVARKLDK